MLVWGEISTYLVTRSDVISVKVKETHREDKHRREELFFFFFYAQNIENWEFSSTLTLRELFAL